MKNRLREVWIGNPSISVTAVTVIHACNRRYPFNLTTPKPTFLCSRSGNSNRAFSASALLLNGFESGVNSPLTYLKSSHFSMIFGMAIYNTGVH